MMRKGITGDSRKSTPMEKAVKETNKAMKQQVVWRGWSFAS